MFMKPQESQIFFDLLEKIKSICIVTLTDKQTQMIRDAAQFLEPHIELYSQYYSTCPLDELQLAKGRREKKAIDKVYRCLCELLRISENWLYIYDNNRSKLPDKWLEMVEILNRYINSKEFNSSINSIGK